MRSAAAAGGRADVPRSRQAASHDGARLLAPPGAGRVRHDPAPSMPAADVRARARPPPSRRCPARDVGLQAFDRFTIPPLSRADPGVARRLTAGGRRRRDRVLHRLQHRAAGLGRGVRPLRPGARDARDGARRDARLPRGRGRAGDRRARRRPGRRRPALRRARADLDHVPRRHDPARPAAALARPADGRVVARHGPRHARRRGGRRRRLLAARDRAARHAGGGARLAAPAPCPSRRAPRRGRSPAASRESSPIAGCSP